jgi:2-dehydropantoate 2-reductase
MKAYRIPVVNLPGTPVRLLALAVNTIPPVIARPLLKKAVIGGRGDKMPSFYIDMQSGRPFSEVDYLNGAVSRWGERKSIATPANTFLTQTLLRIVNGQIPKEKYQNNPDEFLRLSQKWWVFEVKKEGFL